MTGDVEESYCVEKCRKLIRHKPTANSKLTKSAQEQITFIESRKHFFISNKKLAQSMGMSVRQIQYNWRLLEATGHIVSQFRYRPNGSYTTSSRTVSKLVTPLTPRFKPKTLLHYLKNLGLKIEKKEKQRYDYATKTQSFEDLEPIVKPVGNGCISLAQAMLAKLNGKPLTRPETSDQLGVDVIIA